MAKRKDKKKVKRITWAKVDFISLVPRGANTFSTIYKGEDGDSQVDLTTLCKDMNEKGEIARVIAGDPRAVMDVGVRFSRQFSQVAASTPFDLVIASPGGHPRDSNFYQSQKPLAHASRVVVTDGTVILVAACPEGVGSRRYESWMNGVRSHNEVLARFQRQGFLAGPHKALLVARDAVRVNVFLVSDMPLIACATSF